MEILMLTRSIFRMHGYGGMERHCHDFIQEMSSRGFVIHVVTMPPQRPETLSDYGPNTRFYFIPGRPARRIFHRITSYPAWVRRVKTFVRKFLEHTKVQVIYAHGLAIGACEGTQLPIIYNPYGLEEFKTGGLKYLAYAPFRVISRKHAPLANFIIAGDNVLEPEISKLLRVPAERVVVVQNAVTLEPEPAAPPPLPYHGDPLLMTAGRMESNKGLAFLIQALASAQDLPAGWRLVMAGGGSLQQALQQLAKQFGLSNRIDFAGELSDEGFRALFHQADLFINPTLFEGSSIVTLEAMKYGLPILGSIAGGIPDKVQPGMNGWLVPPGDVAALTAGLETACAQRERWKEMGRESRRIVEQRFSWQVAAQRFLDLFQKLL